MALKVEKKVSSDWKKYLTRAIRKEIYQEVGSKVSLRQMQRIIQDEILDDYGVLELAISKANKRMDEVIKLKNKLLSVKHQSAHSLKSK